MAGGPIAFSVQPTEKTIPLGFSVSVTGAGKKGIGAIAVKNDVGTIAIAGTTYPVLTYEHQAWPSQGYDLYQGLAVGKDRLFLLWFYCEGPKLSYIYYEGTDGTKIDYETAAAGSTCDQSGAPVSPLVAFPAVEMAVPPLVSTFTVDGPQVSIPPGKPGALTLGPLALEVYPFDVVDCTKDCGTPGWWELHSLLWDPKTSRLCFAIFYLMVGQTGTQVTYSLTLPDLSDPVGTTNLTATWSGPG